MSRIVQVVLNLTEIKVLWKELIDAECTKPKLPIELDFKEAWTEIRSMSSIWWWPTKAY